MQIFTAPKVVNDFRNSHVPRWIFYRLLLTFQSLDPIPRLDNNSKKKKKKKVESQDYKLHNTRVSSSYISTQIYHYLKLPPKNHPRRIKLGDLFLYSRHEESLYIFIPVDKSA